MSSVDGDTLHLSGVFDVFPSCPHNHQEVSHKECAHKAHNHGILGKGRKQLSGARRVDKVGSDKEGAPEEGEVVAEALGD